MHFFKATYDTYFIFCMFQNSLYIYNHIYFLVCVCMCVMYACKTLCPLKAEEFGGDKIFLKSHQMTLDQSQNDWRDQAILHGFGYKGRKRDKYVYVVLFSPHICIAHCLRIRSQRRLGAKTWQLWAQRMKTQLGVLSQNLAH